MRAFLAVVVAASFAVPLAAHAQVEDPDNTVADGGVLPAGWSARVDGNGSLDNVRFVEVADGYHATMGPAAVFYNQDWGKSGDYEVSARMTQMIAPRHPEAYGLVIGGANLDEPTQSYSYFLVRGTGEYFIATRNGDERVKIVDWTAHPAIEKQDDEGTQTNVLGIEVSGDQVIFSVNGTEVTRRPTAEIATNGLFGFRINHNLDVMIDQVDRGES
ncbi:MAG TPA: hypothetical protein VFI91_01040 [Longimicrobiaceae bacterium]|nr:hypothetical protein [Longimicrobiaceae bacterium]